MGEDQATPVPRPCRHSNQRLDAEAGEILCLKCGAVRGMGEDVWEQEGEGHE